MQCCILSQCNVNISNNDDKKKQFRYRLIYCNLLLLNLL